MTIDSVFQHISKKINQITDWGVKNVYPDIENRSIRFSNAVFLIILSMQVIAFFTELKVFLHPQQMVWDQWSIPIMIFFAMMSLGLNRMHYSLISRIMLLVVWPAVTYIIPIIVQHTPTDYYVGYPIALIFHGFLIQITLPYAEYKKLLIIFLLINLGLIITFQDLLIHFDQQPEVLISMTGNQYYFSNAFTFWLALNLILFFLLKSLNRRIEEINQQKNLLASKKEELEVAMEELSNRQGQLVHSEKMASLVKLSAGLAHQINNPLNYIMGARDLIKKQIPEASLMEEETEELFEMMTAGISRIQEIVKNLGLLTTTSANQENYSESFNVHAFMQNTIMSVRTSQTQNIITRNTIDESIVIKQNPVLIAQVLFQVLNNAVDAINQSEGEIKLSYTQKGRKGKFEISDTGKGMSSDEISKAMDPFYTTKEAGKGTGLGLFIASSIISEMNGTMSISSSKGAGTTVSFELPVS